MSTTQNHPRAVFGPGEIANLTSAYDAALSSVTEDGGPGSGLTAREVRRQIAASIIEAAKQGQLDPETLKTAALRSFERPFAELD